MPRPERSRAPARATDAPHGFAPATDALRGFAPVVGARARVLVLGTMPSARSLELAEYYGHPRNAFWDVVAGLDGSPVPVFRALDYAERCRRLTRLEIALWDVLAECERVGSLDAAIRSPRANDFGAFLARHPELETIAFNGRAARRLFDRYVDPPRHLALIDLPSTSPANVRRGKVAVWSAALGGRTSQRARVRDRT